MEKEMKIVPPKGYEIDRENSTLDCIKFKPISSHLPETWEEFCKVCPIQEGEAFINNVSMVVTVDFGMNRSFSNKNTLPSEEMAKAMLALCQLIQLRDCYNQGWKLDLESNEQKYAIISTKDGLQTHSYFEISRVLTFKTQELCEEFLKNFEDLIKVARPLL